MANPFQVQEKRMHEERRFVILNLEGNLIDDAQGHGYNSAAKAYKAGWYKFGGGKAKKDLLKKEALDFWSSILNKDLIAQDLMEAAFRATKDRENFTYQDAVEYIKAEYNLEVKPSWVEFLLDT